MGFPQRCSLVTLLSLLCTHSHLEFSPLPMSLYSQLQVCASRTFSNDTITFYVCICVCVCVCACVYVCMCVCVHVCVYVHVCMYACMYAWMPNYCFQPRTVQLPANTHVVLEAMSRDQQSSSTVIVDYFQVTCPRQSQSSAVFTHSFLPSSSVLQGVSQTQLWCSF